jgi:hypothetical protein
MVARRVAAGRRRRGRPLITRRIGDGEFRSDWLKLPVEVHLRDLKPDQPHVAIEWRSVTSPLRQPKVVFAFNYGSA